MRQPILSLIILILSTGHLYCSKEDKLQFVFVQKWGTEGEMPGQCQGPIGIAVDDVGSVYVSDSGNNRIQKFDILGNFLAEWGKEGNARGELARPMHIEMKDSKLYVAEYFNDRIQVFNPSGSSIGTIGRRQEEDTYFDAPAGVSVDS